MLLFFAITITFGTSNAACKLRARRHHACKRTSGNFLRQSVNCFSANMQHALRDAHLHERHALRHDAIWKLYADAPRNPQRMRARRPHAPAWTIGALLCLCLGALSSYVLHEFAVENVFRRRLGWFGIVQFCLVHSNAIATTTASGILHAW